MTEATCMHTLRMDSLHARNDVEHVGQIIKTSEPLMSLIDSILAVKLIKQKALDSFLSIAAMLFCIVS